MFIYSTELHDALKASLDRGHPVLADVHWMGMKPDQYVLTEIKQFDKLVKNLSQGDQVYFDFEPDWKTDVIIGLDLLSLFLSKEVNETRVLHNLNTDEESLYVPFVDEMHWPFGFCKLFKGKSVDVILQWNPDYTMVYSL